jgi:dihydropteroate synthase
LAALESGDALRLAGSDVAFTTLEILARTNDGIVSALTSLAQLRAWLAAKNQAARVEIETQLFHLSAARATWAGLKLDRPLVMGIVNVTPDSFYSIGSGDAGAAIALGRAMVAAGADILDIGGESTRPGATLVPQEEEMRRLEPVIRALADSGATISVDTRKPRVMAAALSWGARIINDVSALEGEGSLEAVARSNAAVVLMHMRGEPETMQRDPRYALASPDVSDYLAARIAACAAAGLSPDRIVVDPGIGFGKTVAHNLEILARLTLFHALGCGVLVGLSRKSTIGRVSDGAPVEARLPGSIAGALAALHQGVQILRVHDVAETRQAIAMWQAIASGA